MGGKTKHVQRTKNNAKPSSSSRSAELLASSSLSTNVGFANVTEFGFLPTMLQNFSLADTSTSIDDLDAKIDTNYQLVFRKMTKKDPITKVKALQEFNELLADADANTVKSILPFWPRLFNNLATDVEHRVREATQNAHATLVNKAGKSIAPHLKQICAAWITSQYDTYAPAASLATTSFQKAFPPHKLQDVFNFCQNEILDYIIKNLTVHTATTLSNPQSNSPEECEAKYQRVIICSLKGYALYLSRMTEELLKEASNRNIALIEHSKFWSYAKHKNPSIRAAWFEALSSLLQYSKEFLVNIEKQTTVTPFQNLDETETVILPHLWAAILLVTQKIDNWHQHVNMEKMLLPKLWKLLKSGGSGNAPTVYPHFWPLLSKLDHTILGDKICQFYLNFFENMDSGLRARVSHAANSRTDISEIAKALFECMKYIFVQLQSIPDDAFPDDLPLNKLCTQMVKQHGIELIDFLLDSENVPNAKYVLAHFAKLIRFWSEKCDENELYRNVLAVFWAEIYTSVEKSTVAERGDRHLKSNLELIFDFVHWMYTDEEAITKGNKVKFDEEKSESDEIDGDMKNKRKTHSSPESLIKSINELIIKLCKLYMKRTTDTTNIVYIHELQRLLERYRSESLFIELAGSQNDVAKLYDKFASWLLVPQLRCESAVDITLMLHDVLSDNEKTKLLNKLVKFPNQIVQNWILSRILSYPLCQSADVLRLLTQPEVNALLLKVTRAIVDGNENADDINLLHKCFFQNESGNILIDCSTSNAIVDILLQPLNDESVDESILDTCASFLAQIMPTICNDSAKKDLQTKLFTNLFKLSSNRYATQKLSEDTLWELVTSWQDALSSGDIDADNQIIDACCEIVNANITQIIDSKRPNEVVDIESLAEISSKLVLCSIENNDDQSKPKRTLEIVERLFAESVQRRQERLTNVTNYCAFVALSCGQLNLAQIDETCIQLTQANTNDDIRELLLTSLFLFETVLKMTCNVRPTKKGTDSTEVNPDDEHTEDFCDFDEMLLKKWPVPVYDEAIHAIQVSTLFNVLMSNSLFSSESEYSMIFFEERLNLFLDKIDSSQATIVKERLFDKIKTSNPFWAQSSLALLKIEPYRSSGDGLSMLHNDFTLILNDPKWLTANLNVLQCFTTKLRDRQLSIAANLMNDRSDAQYVHRCIGLRCLLLNYFRGNFNEIGDKEILDESNKLIEELCALSKVDKEFLLYNEALDGISFERVQHCVGIIHFLTDYIRTSYKNIKSSGWDFIRIALSSWVLLLSKNSEHWKNPKIAVFIGAVYQLFAALGEFILIERERSSTRELSNVIDEWEHVFAKDVNLILLRCFMKFIQLNDKTIDDCRTEHFIRIVSGCAHSIDLKYVQFEHKIDSKTSIDDLITFALTNLSNKYHFVRAACATIIKRMVPYFIDKDMAQLMKRSDGVQKTNEIDSDWHFLSKFSKSLDNHIEWTQSYIDEFSYKATELDELSEVPRENSIPFLLLWDCVLTVCEKSSSELLSIYASYIAGKKYDNLLLSTIFRLMPIEVLKNQESKATGTVYFTPLSWSTIASDLISPERYACFVYTLSLKFLPAIVRKWWTDTQPRQKNLVDKITTAFVSTQLCTEELRALVDKWEKNDNFQIIVHNSTREVHATYIVDEARMELIIQLPINYPLGTVKVSSGQQIGDKLQSRVVVMQLSIFLTHQNGSIGDVLVLWKRNLDRKFEGVEECYVCYSVIHQETCQLPKLTCKTCKKRFHGQCLYKWFNTSNKSTCPICRNIF